MMYLLFSMGCTKFLSIINFLWNDLIFLYYVVLDKGYYILNLKIRSHFREAIKLRMEQNQLGHACIFYGSCLSVLYGV